MSNDTMKDAVEELREAREQVSSHVQQLELKIKVVTAQLESQEKYYAGINELLDRLASVRGDAQKQRVANQILDLRNRKRSLKKVDTEE